MFIRAPYYYYLIEIFLLLCFFPQTKYFITPSFWTATWSVLRGRTLLHKLLQMNATVDVTPKLSCYYYNCCDPCVTINMTL